MTPDSSLAKMQNCIASHYAAMQPPAPTQRLEALIRAGVVPRPAGPSHLCAAASRAYRERTGLSVAEWAFLLNLSPPSVIMGEHRGLLFPAAMAPVLKALADKLQPHTAAW